MLDAVRLAIAHQDVRTALSDRAHQGGYVAYSVLTVRIHHCTLAICG